MGEASFGGFAFAKKKKKEKKERKSHTNSREVATFRAYFAFGE